MSRVRGMCLVGLFFGTGISAIAQDNVFAGVIGGIATLSADARTAISSLPAAGAYKPENGPALNVFGGWNFSEYVGVQGNYIRNSNDVALSAILGADSFEQARGSSQDAFIGDILLFFRNRSSWVRPYLSAGGGAVRIESRATAVRYSSGVLPLPPDEFSTVRFGFRVAVGIDLLSKNGWGFRYSFSETKSGNPFSGQLSPPGQRRLANFQNLFGFVKYFGHRS